MAAKKTKKPKSRKTLKNKALLAVKPLRAYPPDPYSQVWRKAAGRNRKQFGSGTACQPPRALFTTSWKAGLEADRKT